MEIHQGNQLIKRITENRPDLILMATDMQPVDGFAVCAQLRGRCRFEHIPILLFIPENNASQVARAYEAGADDYLVPPVQWQCLALRIAHHLQRWRAMETLRNQITKLQLTRLSTEIATHAKTEFFAHVSHELRTPMHGILSYARFGLKRVAKAPREKLEVYFHEIEDCGTRLLDLLNDMVELAKLEAGKVEYDLRPADIVGEIATVVDEIAHLATDRQVTLSKHFPRQSIPVRFDRLWMNRAMRIMLVNAVNRSKPGDSIQLNIQKINAHEMQNQQVTIAITDQGPDIRGDDGDQLLEKQFHDREHKDTSYTTAIGLAICKLIIQDHQGTIHVCRNLGGGTVFTFVLPVFREAASIG